MMVSFGTLFPEMADCETSTLVVPRDAELPEGEYGFCEFYCDFPRCDCRYALVVVHTSDCSLDWAVIKYGWEPPAYYARTMGCTIAQARQLCAPELDWCHPQSPYAPVLLRLFTENILGPEFAKQLAYHYKLFKNAVRLQSAS
jgi:hypothetical protein